MYICGDVAGSSNLLVSNLMNMKEKKYQVSQECFFTIAIYNLLESNPTNMKKEISSKSRMFL